MHHGGHGHVPPMMEIPPFHPGVHQHHQYQHQPFNPFMQAPPPTHPTQPTSFAPSSFIHQDTGYETMDQDGSPMGSDPSDERMGSIDKLFHGQSSLGGFQQRQSGGMVMNSDPFQPLGEKFRFHATLSAPTAMIRHAEEIPVTYLNKGQSYTLSIIDTTPSLPILPGTRFRTFVRISFEDEQQRKKPGVCWSLWKEGRGTNEAHQRGGKLQAVEYVESAQPAEGDEKRSRVELEYASFDGFSVVWTPGTHGNVECSIAVRFNFLSTDFSHSKGVKGIPVRLCAKTSVLPTDPSTSPPPESSEICYCKVKLFRDHGAERKLSNDVAHVKKTIDKLKQQIAQAESGMKDFGKRKRGGVSQAKVPENQRPGKVQKHKRTWSMSSVSSAGGARPPLEEDLHFKLQTLQDMFTSTRPVSVLYLRGDDLDDPDTHPVSLPGESLELTKTESRETTAWRSDRISVASSSLVSPSPSSLSLHSHASAVGPTQPWQGFQRVGSGEPQARQQQHAPEQLTKVREIRDESGNLIKWIEALGVDQSYQPPPERSAKPVACFYIARQYPGSEGSREIHRAVYLMQRTAKEFVLQVAGKWRLDPAKVVKAVHVLHRGLEVELDDDVIRELNEGQDMVLEISEISTGGTAPPPPKREWDMAVDAPGESESPSPTATIPAAQSVYELRFMF